MNKDEILAKSREENKIVDEYETHVRLRAGKISKAVGVALASILVLVDAIVLDSSVIGWTALTIAFGMNAVEDWIVVIMAKSKTDWFAIIFDSLIFVASVIRLIVSVL